MRLIRFGVLLFLVLAVPSLLDAQLDFKRGDADLSGCVDGFDAFFIINATFIPTAPQPQCIAAADANGDGQFNGLIDTLFLFGHLFQGGPPPPAPGPDVCGPDPNLLPCAVYDACDPCIPVEEECVVEDNGSGTIDLPPASCGYLTADELHMIVDGLPPGTTINVHIIHGGFSGVMTTPGGNLGGEVEQFDSVVFIEMEGTGDLAGFQANIGLNAPVEIHTAPTQPGMPVQTFETEMVALQADLGPLGDGNFEMLNIVAGSDFGLFSPGETTLYQQTPLVGDPEYIVDSRFEVNYQIEFVGAGGGPLAGMTGITTATVSVGTPLALQDFIRGDADGDGTFNGLADGLYTLEHGFLGGPAPPCMESADADADGIFNALADGLYVLEHAFLGGPPPGAPYPACGADPDEPNSLGCAPNACL